jgi:3'-phosphoadenosine 5'-phosphosulfate sulfotransferase
MKKDLFLIFMLTLLLSAAHAQKVRYKDLFPRFAGMTTPELRNALKEYLVEDLEHPNANFRLALVYEQNYKTADPLTQHASALALETFN